VGLFQRVDSDEHGLRVIRGGSWMSESSDLRASFQGCDTADTCNVDVGLRLAQDIEQLLPVPIVQDVPTVPMVGQAAVPAVPTSVPEIPSVPVVPHLRFI
jgi:hypothetical protein